jgi:hypothetical protein
VWYGGGEERRGEASRVAVGPFKGSGAEQRGVRGDW